MLSQKDKMHADDVAAFENMDGRLVMIELLKNRGIAGFPDTRFIPLESLRDAAIIHYGWKFTETVKRYAAYNLMRFYRRNGYEIGGSDKKETVKMTMSVFNEVEKYENEWRVRTAKQVAPAKKLKSCLKCSAEIVNQGRTFLCEHCLNEQTAERETVLDSIHGEQ